jgi:adenine-specific DNA-methyltransferase
VKAIKQLLRPERLRQVPEQFSWVDQALVQKHFIDRCEQPFNEAAYWLATAYAVWIGEETRTQRALFFTPPTLADRVIANLVKQGASLAHHHWHDQLAAVRHS